MTPWNGVPENPERRWTDEKVVALVSRLSRRLGWSASGESDVTDVANAFTALILERQQRDIDIAAAREAGRREGAAEMRERCIAVCERGAEIQVSAKAREGAARCADAIRSVRLTTPAPATREGEA